MIELRLLGTVGLTDATGGDAAARSLLAQPRRLALLAYLAAATPRTLHRRDVLLPLFWPELDQSRARAALRQALHVIRAKLGADALVSRGDEEVGIDFERVRCDVIELERAIASGKPADALDLYRGPLLEGFFIADAPEFERWLEGERARLHEQVLEAARTVITACERAGDLSAAVRWARHAARLAPLDEAGHRRLITLLDRLGDRAGALQAYDTFAERLRQEFETQPSAETQSVVAAVRARQTAVESAIAASPAPAVPPSRSPAPAPPPRSGVRPSRGGGWWVGAGLVAALGVVAAVNAGTWRGRVERPSRPNARTLAVLPLQDLSGDTTHSDVAEAMAMALTTTLGSTESLRVTAPLSADRFKGQRIPERAIGESLGVAELVEGDLQRVHDSLRVDLRLIDAASEQQRWGGQFEGAFDSRIELEEAMSRAILSALQVPRSLRPPPTSNPAAYDFYMRGKIRVQHEDRGNDSIAIVLLERAVALDPGFAVAYAELAHAYGLRSLQFDPEDGDARERAQVASAKALALGPDLAESHFAQAFLLWSRERRYPHQSVISEDHQALLLNPNLAVAHQHLGQVYLHIGLLDSAIAEFRTTLALDPVEGLALQRIGIALVYQGHYEEGLRTFREVPSDLNPALWHYQVAWALLYLGRDSEALDTINLYLHDHPKDPGGLLTAARAILDAKRGDAGATEADIKTAIAKGSGFQHFHHAAYSIAMAYALLHRPEPAVRFLREAADEGLPCYPCFRNDPYLAAIRGDTGYVSLMRELESQWNEWRGALRGAP